MPVNVSLNRDELSKKKLMLATPMYGGQCTGMFTKSVADLAVLLNYWGVSLHLHFLFNESLITRARNYCASAFMDHSDCTHLMFIDSDIGFNPMDVLGMLAMMDDDSEYDVLTGPYPKKCIAWEKIKAAVDLGLADEDPNALERFVGDYVFNPLPGTETIQIDSPTEVLEAGTGFMMIRRRAFELVKARRPDLMYRPDHARTANFDGSMEIMAYFMDPIDRWSREDVYRRALEEAMADDTGDLDFVKTRIKVALDHSEPESKRLLSEDYFFTQEVRKAGGKVWLCPWMKLQHVGTYTFSGSLADLAQIGASATVDPSKIKKK